MNRRDPGVDLLRILGILAIVAGHVWPTPVVRDIVYSWHVPVFFYLSGYLWARNRSVAEEVRARSRSLLRPYMFWGILIFAAYASALFLRNEASGPVLLAPLYGGRYAGGPFSTFWFVSTLFVCALLWRFLSITPIWTRVAIVVFASVLGWVYGPELSATPLAIGNAIPALTFVAAGQAARHMKLGEQKWSSVVACCSLIVAAAAVLTGASKPVDIKQGDWGTPLLSTVTAIVICSAMIVLVEHYSALITAVWASRITAGARAGLTVILLHPSIIACGSAIDAPEALTFGCAAVVPLAIGLVAVSTPLSTWMTGSPRTTRTPPHRLAGRRARASTQ